MTLQEKQQLAMILIDSLISNADKLDQLTYDSVCKNDQKGLGRIGISYQEFHLLQLKKIIGEIFNETQKQQ